MRDYKKTRSVYLLGYKVGEESQLAAGKILSIVATNIVIEAQKYDNVPTGIIRRVSKRYFSRRKVFLVLKKCRSTDLLKCD